MNQGISPTFKQKHHSAPANRKIARFRAIAATQTRLPAAPFALRKAAQFFFFVDDRQLYYYTFNKALLNLS